MNDWYELLHDLETEVQPLDEVTQARIENRVRTVLPRRRQRPQLIAIIAAVLILTACGYAAVTGQFSDWFWSVSDFEAPETDEDLLSSMGTVIDQSQTVNGDTVTLHGAIWDGKTLMLSATVESGSIPADAWRTVESEDSWLHATCESVRNIWLEQRADRMDPAVFEENLSDMLQMMHEHFTPKIAYLYNQHTDSYYLQIEIEYPSNHESLEMELHLENLQFTNTSEPLKGPFDFTFTVERRYPEVVYEGSALVKQENGIDLDIKKVVLTPLNAEVFFEVPGLVSKELFQSDWNLSSLERLRIGEETVKFSASSSQMGRYEEPGILTGSFHRGPFERVVDPAQVDAVGINDLWLELGTFTLVPIMED